MKYYKRIQDRSYGLILGNIYPADYKLSAKKSVQDSVQDGGGDLWEEVEEYEYYQQEGLPEKWRTKDCEEVSKWAAKTFDCVEYTSSDKYLCIEQSLFPDDSCYHFIDVRQSSRIGEYTEISFDTFKKLVLKQNDMKDREIIGYKLVKPEYQNLVVKALQLNSVYEPNIIIAGMIGYYIPKIKELGIMDWFEPVYKPSCPQIEVNGYKGEFFDDYVKFGCAKIEKAYILKINDILSNTYWKRSDYKTITSITIGKGTFTEEQIKLIAEYYINK